MIKKLFVAFFFITSIAGLKAQVTGIHNFYTINPFYFSPAHTGDKEQFAAFLDYRDHLIGLNPSLKSANFGLHAPITKHMNLGGLIRTERLGLFETLSARLDYAFRTKIAENHILAFGINGGAMQRNLSIENAVVFETGDPTLSPDYAQDYIWFAGASVNYQFKNLSFDFGIPVLYKSNTNYFKNYWAFLAYNIITKGQKWMFQPSAALHYLENKKLGYNANLLINYDNTFWVQPTYKANRSIAVSVGVNLRKIGIAYAYETNSSNLSVIGGPSHEIMISYGFFKTKALPVEDSAYSHQLVPKIGDKTYEEYISSDNYGFYGSIINLTDSMHREEVKRDSIRTVVRRDSLQRVYKDSLEVVKRDSVRKHTLRHLSDDELKLLETGVHFELGSASIDSKSREYLNKVAILIKNNENIRVLITGHTCDLGSEEANLRFSMDRAEAVKYYLIRQGVSPGRVSTDGKLDAEPVVPNISEENRKLNRRVTFSIIRE
jgi:type IX secretion system PorP/SprF family membrane protein